MSISNLILRKVIRPADVIVVNRTNRGLLNLIDHYLVYMGNDRLGNPWFMANIGDRVQWMSSQDIARRASGFEIDRIRRFQGSDRQRNEALQRAREMEGRNYSLLGYNCEHFANWVQVGEARSHQANLGIGVGVALALVVVGFLASRE